MAKSKTTLRGEIVAVDANDTTGLTQEVLRVMLNTLVHCNSAESLNHYAAIIQIIDAEVDAKIAAL